MWSTFKEGRRYFYLGRLESRSISFAKGAEEKQEVAQMRERKRLTKLGELKEDGNHFTCAKEVQNKEELWL